MLAGSSACTISSAPSSAACRAALASCASSSGGNSATPESTMKHLNPNTPSSCSRSRSDSLPGIAPPQNPTSTWHWPSAAARLAASAAASVVAGIELSGMSMIVVMPPAAAASVAVAKPSQLVRPGSLTCTWLSTRPGSSTSSSARSTISASPAARPGSAPARPAPPAPAPPAPARPASALPAASGRLGVEAGPR